jgi:recombination protein RecA
MSDFFEKLQAGIDKNVKGVHASMMADSAIATEHYWVKTPAYDLNRALSGCTQRGIQSRNLVAIIGPEHTFKSSFMILCMVEAVKAGKKAVILDTEGGLKKEFCARWGLDLDQVYYVYTPFISEVRSVLAQIRETGETNLIIGLDSVGGLDRLKQFEDAAKGEMKADQGLLQKEIRSMLKLFLNICIGQNSIGIATGHMYGSPGRGTPIPDQIGGGKAMKLFPSILIQLYKKSIYEFPNKKGKERGKVIGSEIKASTLKNRMYPPFQTATVKMNYTDGIQPYAGLLDLAVTADIIEKNGAWYSYKGEKRQGELNAEDLVKADGFLNTLDSWLEKTGYSTVSEEIQQAEELLAEEKNQRKDRKIDKED